RKNLEYTLEVEGVDKPLPGRTDEEGYTQEHEVPAVAESGRLTLHVPQADGSRKDESYELQIGHLDPVKETHGVVDRLVNLGFLPPGTPKDVPADELDEALDAFRQRFGLDPGKPGIDRELQVKLRSLHGC